MGDEGMQAFVVVPDRAGSSRRDRSWSISLAPSNDHDMPLCFMRLATTFLHALAPLRTMTQKDGCSTRRIGAASCALTLAGKSPETTLLTTNALRASLPCPTGVSRP